MDAELGKSFKICFFFLKLTGFWMDGKQSWKYTIYGFLTIFVFLILYTVSLTAYFFNTEDFDEKIESVVLILIHFIAISKAFNVIFNLKAMIKMYESLEDLLKISANPLKLRRHCIIKSVKLAYNVMKTIWSAIILTWLIAVFFAIFHNKMTYNGWFPFSTEVGTLGFKIAAAYMTTDCIVAGSLSVVLSVLPINFMSFIIGIIDELSERLAEVKDKEELIKCIKIHQRTMQFTKEIEEFFKQPIFTQVLLSSVIMCTIVVAMSNLSVDQEIFGEIFGFILTSYFHFSFNRRRKFQAFFKQCLFLHRSHLEFFSLAISETSFQFHQRSFQLHCFILIGRNLTPKLRV